MRHTHRFGVEIDRDGPTELRLEFTEPVDAETAVVELLDVQQ